METRLRKVVWLVVSLMYFFEGHAQYLRDLVNESRAVLDEYKSRFGVQYVLDAIKQCYRYGRESAAKLTLKE